MKRALFACAFLLVLSLTISIARADTYSGTWSIMPSSKAGDVHLSMEYRRVDGEGTSEWDESNDIPRSQLHGFPANSFSIVQDAGEFRATGAISNGTGGGTWTFVPSATFANELQRRGVGRPSEQQQFQLALGRFKLATLDVLAHSGFQTPSVADLVRMAQHGVSDDYINAMKDVRLSPKTVGELIRLRDHGVSPAYAADMLRRAPNLSGEDLVEMRDHGVSTDYMQALAANGYANIAPQKAVELRDHGVSVNYLEGLSRLNYHPSPDDLVRLADHGVSIPFIERLRGHGYSHLSVDDLIKLRDHGF